MNTDKATRIVSIIVAVILVIYLGSNILGTAGNSIKTMTAYVQTVSDTVDAEMFIIRDEALIDGGDSDVIVPLVTDGEKISNGSEIAAVFSDEKSAENYSKSISLNKKLETYEKIDGNLKLANLNLDSLESEIDSDFYSILDAVYNNDYSTLTDDELTFCENLSRKNVSLGYDVDCTEKIAEINKEISSLSASTPKKMISAQYAGFYVSRPDGYENILTVDDIDSLDEEKLNKAFEAEKADVPENSLGKIVKGFDWYAATIVDGFSGIEAGKNVEISLGNTREGTITAALYSKTNLEDGRVMLVFRCSEVNSELMALRKTNAKIVVKNYTGIKINKEAIRFNEDKEEGVYIVEGNLIKFNRIEELYSNDSIVVVKNKVGESGWLSQYDEVVVSGKGLSNGKVIS